VIGHRQKIKEAGSRNLQVAKKTENQVIKKLGYGYQ
jgi:hypothetical protein